MPTVADASQTGELLPGLHRVYLPYGNRALYQHVLIGEAFVVLVDTGVFDTPSATAPYLARQGVSPDDVRLAIISHADADHFGGNYLTRRLYPHCLIAAHAGDQAWIEDPELALRERYGEFGAYGLPLPAEQADRLRRMMGTATPVDLILSGGESIRLAEGEVWQILHAPGHSPGHLVLWHRSRRAAIICDAVLGDGIPSSEGMLALGPTYRYTADYLYTIDRLEALQAEWLFTSHFPVLRGPEVGRFLQRSRAWVRRVEVAVRQAIAAAGEPLPLAEIIARTAASLGDWNDPARAGLEYPLLGGLEYLEQRQVIRRETRGAAIVWRALKDLEHEFGGAGSRGHAAGCA